MEAPTSVPVVHQFDTQGHRILCGVPGFDRSTKHSRAVTCPSCVGLLRGKEGRPTTAPASGGTAAH